MTIKSPLPLKYSFPVIDDLLKSLYGATHGIFDPSVIEGHRRWKILRSDISKMTAWKSIYLRVEEFL